MARKPVTKRRPPHVEWTEHEWFLIVSEAIKVRDKTGLALTSAIAKVQPQVLAEDRWRPTITSAGSRAVARDYEARVRAGWHGPDTPAPAGPQASAPTAATAGAPDDNASTQKERDAALAATFTATGRVVWTLREWAIISTAVETRINAGDTRGLARIFFETQAEVLPLDRCKPLGSLASLPPLQRAYDEARRDAWSLLPAPLLAKLRGRGEEYEEQQRRTREGLAVTLPAPAPEPAPAPAAPLAFESQEGDPLAARITSILADAGARIAQATRAHVTEQLEAHMASLVAGIALTLREHVQTILAAELGGPLKAEQAPHSGGTNGPPEGTPPKPDEAPPESQAGAPPARRIKVDVVGLSGNSRGEVRQAAERLGIDARFVDAHDAKGHTWTPRKNVILATKFISHDSDNAARKAGSTLMRANAGPQSVVGILESLAEHAGALQ